MFSQFPFYMLLSSSVLFLLTWWGRNIVKENLSFNKLEKPLLKSKGTETIDNNIKSLNMNIEDIKSQSENITATMQICPPPYLTRRRPWGNQ